MKSSRMFVFAAVLSTIVVAAEAQRRGFSTSGSGSGAYDSNVSTSSWDIDSSLDGDCLAEFNKVCSELSPAQYTTVKAKYDAAIASNYDSNSDFEDAEALGYSLSPSDGTTWSEAKSANSALETDCNDTHSGDCDAVTKTQFVEVNDGRDAAIAAGFDSYSDWSDANAQGYSQNATDQAIWAEAKGNTLTASCEAEVPGETNCANLTKSQYQSAQNGNALMVAKIAKVTAGTLTTADLTELGLDLATNSTLGSSPAQWQLDYLETVLGTGSDITKSDWQSTIDNYDAATASAWYIWKIAASSDTSGTYATSNATTTLFNNAGVSAAVTALGVTNSQIQTDIRSSGFTAAPTSTQMNDFLTEARGFADGTSYASVTTATGNNWSIANYITATTNGGWTSSSADEAEFDECLASSDDATGGSSTCSVTKSGWEAAEAIASVADGDANLTASNVTAILTATGDTANSSLDTSNAKHIDYLQSCASGDDAAQAVSDCASSGSFLANATGFEIGKAIADNSGDYTIASVISTSTLTDVGIASNSTNVIGANYCGSNGTSSCLTALKTALGSSGLTASSTAAQVTAKVNELMRTEMVTVATGASIPSSTPAAGCSTSVNLDVPPICGHPQWTCTMTSAPTGWTFNNNTIVVPANASAATNQSATIQMSLGIYTPAYTRNVTRSYDLATAVAGATNGLKRYSDSAWNAEDPRRGQNACRNKGGRLATLSEFNQTGGSVSHKNFHWSTDDTTINFNTNSSGGNKRTQGHTCNFGSGNNYSRTKNGGYKCWGASTSGSVYYACADLPTCN